MLCCLDPYYYTTKIVTTVEWNTKGSCLFNDGLDPSWTLFGLLKLGQTDGTCLPLNYISSLLETALDSAYGFLRGFI
jgi:hypothetical protein